MVAVDMTWAISRIIIWSLDNNVAVLSIYFERLEVGSELWFCTGVIRLYTFSTTLNSANLISLLDSYAERQKRKPVLCGA